MDRAFLEGLGLETQTVEAVLEEYEKDARGWEEKYSQLQFGGVLERAIAASGGRSAKAITALLDVESLRESEDQPSAVKQALQQLKQEHGYLFESPRPPAYAPGTGTGAFAPEAPQTLAGALREKFQR